MVRQRKLSKRKKGVTSADDMEEAVKRVLNGQSLRHVCTDTSINFSTLQRYVNRARKTNDTNTIAFTPNYSCRKVFTDNEENELEQYLLKASKMHYGLVSKQVRSLAFEFAKKNNKPFPKSWTENLRAGEDWFNGFMRRDTRSCHYVVRRPPVFLGQQVLIKRMFKNFMIICKKLWNSTILSPRTSIIAMKLGVQLCKRYRTKRLWPAAKTNKSKGGRKRGATVILTSTPVKNSLKLKEVEKNEKRKTKSKRPVKRKLGLLAPVKEDNDSDEECDCSVIDNSDSSSSSDEEEGITSPDLNILDENDFVLVKFPTKKNDIFYLGIIIEKTGDLFEIKFLRRERPGSLSFIFPQVEDVMDVKLEDIIGKLPKPTMQGGTARLARHHVFPVNFGKYCESLR